MVELHTLGGAASTPSAISDRGQAIGNSLINQSGDERPFLWQRGRMTDLLAGRTARGGRADDLSDTGMMTDSADPGRRSLAAAALAGRMVELGVPDTRACRRQRSQGCRRSFVAADGSPRGVGPPAQRAHHVLPKPASDIAIKVIGIDRHSTVGVGQESTAAGFMVARSN